MEEKSTETRRHGSENKKVELPSCGCLTPPASADSVHKLLHQGSSISLELGPVLETEAKSGAGGYESSR